jgi:fructose-bisphosphate aldolase class I
MDKEKLIETVTRLVSPPKGILAIDESLSTCNKRFEKLGVPTTEEKRKDYRELLITAPEIEKYISGYILFDETIRQSTINDKSFVSVLQAKSIDVGIKVDQGLIELSSGSSDSVESSRRGEKITQGLDGLSARLKEYKNMGATFAKWRAVYTISKNTPSLECMKKNAILFAQYATLCQKNGLVPIIEPEVLIDGEHTIEQCFDVTAKNLDIIFTELQKMNVFISGMILKTSMVIAGIDAKEKSSTENVAKMTIKCLEEHVPMHIGGIVFLSGGQSDEEATMNLNAMHKMGPLPWPLTFSYGRAIQNSVLLSWAKNPSDIAGAQALLLIAAKNNSLASVGKYNK